MMANLSWNEAKSASGRWGAMRGCGAVPTLLNMKNVSGLPITPPMLSPKANEKPTTYHRIEITPSAIKLWSMVEITLRLLTMPP